MIYPLEAVLLLCLLAVLAGAESVVDIARFGTKKRALRRRFRPFTDGTPSHLGDIFATLDAEKFQQCFVAWVATLTGASADVIAIDGKTDPTRKRAGKLPSIWSSQRDSGSCSARSRSRRRDRGDPQIAGHVVDRRRHRDH